MTFAYSPEDLSRFRAAQRLAYDAAVHVEQQLAAGMTERDAALLMHDYLKARGVQQYFHKPFVWFGDRTAFVDFWTDLHFFPTRRKLAWGMPVILDVAPVVDGYAADIGYTCTFGENRLHEKMIADLAAYRSLIVEGVRRSKTLQTIYREVDDLIFEQGYQNRHQRYPYAVLAHRVERLDAGPAPKLTLGGFGLSALRWLRQEGKAFERGVKHHSPLWNGSDRSGHRAATGLWAVEPHLGAQGVGAKWEELLVVTGDDAYWLDDDLPHVRRWANAADRVAAAQ